MLKSTLPALLAGAVLALLVFLAAVSQRVMRRMEVNEAAKSTVSSPNNLVESDKMAQLFPATEATDLGIRYKILREGTGPKPVPGNIVTVNYTGRLLDGTIFDDSYKRGKPFSFKLMTDQVIRGWDKSVIDMRKGEKRLVIVPYRLAYGETGRPPVIPPRAALVFEIELLDIRP